MSDCLFCKIAAGELPANVVHEDEHIIAFHDIDPKADTHVLVIPKKHIVNLDDLKPEDEAVLSHLMFTIPKIAKDLGLEGYRTITNTGSLGGQVVFHMHFHILGGGQLPGF
jgi:histidine triad (HIT) family protein